MPLLSLKQVSALLRAYGVRSEAEVKTLSSKLFVMRARGLKGWTLLKALHEELKEVTSKCED